jgi:hypothetical protein
MVFNHHAKDHSQMPKDVSQLHSDEGDILPPDLKFNQDDEEQSYSLPQQPPITPPHQPPITPPQEQQS